MIYISCMRLFKYYGPEGVLSLSTAVPSFQSTGLVIRCSEGFTTSHTADITIAAGGGIFGPGDARAWIPAGGARCGPVDVGACSPWGRVGRVAPENAFFERLGGTTRDGGGISRDS